MGQTKRTSRGTPGEEQHVFATRLLAWYDTHKRDLPWREDRDPYRVWLSEIMLQQTRVAAVLDHYRRFLKKFPTVQKLASAREASVLAAWSGLGYYRRARMLHAAAKQVVKEHGGKFPANSAGLLELPGIGRYTAAAIASIAFREPVAVVDGNVERVVQRFVGERITGEEVWQTVGGWLEARRPGDFNQAMMELGATVCLPRQPRCLLCPVDRCATRGELPTAGVAPRQRKREIHFGLARQNGAVFLVQRKKEESLMAGMWELPEIAPSSLDAKPIVSLRHSITVTDYAVRVREIARPNGAAGKWIPIRRLESLPLTGLARKILRRAEIL
ncbi:MAG TPA: A/G-specific adenine glycosylase [Terriglobales bacterium]|jgi:A/G-specific adenine glycosylase|nr:A/G-specific adenine glycosylase [Terriglobales bacterium]